MVPAVGGFEPGDQAQNVDLPQPLGPTIPTTSPGRDVQRDVAQHLQIAVAVRHRRTATAISESAFELGDVAACRLTVCAEA